MKTVRILLIVLLLIACVGIVQATNTTPYDSNIKFLGHFNQTAGPTSTFYDDSPFHVNLTTAGSATSNSTSGYYVLGNASVYLDGTSGQFVFTDPDSSSLYNPTGCWTYSMMINPSDSASQTNKALISNVVDSSNAYFIGYSNARIYVLSTSGGTNTIYFYTDTMTWTNNQWYQIVVEKQDSYHAVVYRDGKSIPLAYMVSGVGALGGGNNQRLYVGNDPTSGYNRFRGFFDEVVFWNTAIPISDLYPMSYEVRTTLIISPVANFTISNTSGLAPLLTNLTDTSTNTPTSWNWTAYNTGNSTEIILSSVQNPTITFPYAGNYSVMLNASNSAGSNKTALYQSGHWVNISPASPVAAFSGVPTSGLVPLTVKFTDASTNSPTSWQWDFGDGDSTNSTDQNPVHTYNTAGPFNVNLTATNTYGSGYEYKASYITTYWPVTSSFSLFNAAGTAPHTTYLYDTSTNLTPGPVTYLTDFGDGNSSTSANVYFTWNKTGTYNVTHTVSNGLSSSTSFTTVTVGTPTPPVVAPVASFYGGPQTGSVPLTVFFTDVSSNTPTSWFWEFGDGTNSTLQNPNHTYTRSGFRTVNLTATNTAGSNITVRSKFVKVS